MTEQFQPISNTPPAGFAGKLKFYGRMLLDLQLLTIYKDLKKKLTYSHNWALNASHAGRDQQKKLNKKKLTLGPKRSFWALNASRASILVA